MHTRHIIRTFEKIKKMTEGTWIPVKDYEGLYEISDSNEVRNIKNGKNRLLKQAYKGTFNARVGLSKDSSVKSVLVRQLKKNATGRYCDISVIIAGCREMDDYPLLEKVCNEILKGDMRKFEVVTGKQCTVRDGRKFGADRLGEIYAKVNSRPIIEFPADWDEHGKVAGPIRNKQMADYATHLIAFPSKGSKGTRNMIKLAKEAGLVVNVYEI